MVVEEDPQAARSEPGTGRNRVKDPGRTGICLREEWARSVQGKFLAEPGFGAGRLGSDVPQVGVRGFPARSGA